MTDSFAFSMVILINMILPLGILDIYGYMYIYLLHLAPQKL